jgi:hypothetical protein
MAAESGRDYNTVDVSETTFTEYYISSLQNSFVGVPEFELL